MQRSLYRRLYRNLNRNSQKICLCKVILSDYKHHNTAKFLLCIDSNGQFNFASNGYGGRVSDQAITAHSGFNNLVEARDLIMANKSFTIRDELLLRFADLLLLPPGKRGKSPDV